MIAGVLTLLVALTTFCYLVFVRPPSLDTLYARSKVLMDTNDAANWDQALEGPLAQFQANYSAEQGDKADQMRRWFADAEYRQCFEQIKKHVEPDTAEEIAFPTALAEEEGDFEKARQGWEKLQEWPGPWGLYAKRRLEEIKGVDAEEQRLQGEIDKIKQFHRDLDKDNPDLEMLTALRYERFRDYLTAQQSFEQLKVKYAPDLNRRVAYLLAAKKVVELKPQVAKAFGSAEPLSVRLKLLDDHLAAAKENHQQGNNAEAYAIVLHIIALYRDNPETEIQKRVKEATKLKPDVLPGG
jgi:hypothetical protein